MHLDKETVSEIKNILWRFLDPQKDRVFIFGSRALDTARKFSDIDIGIESTRKISSDTLSDLAEAFEESNIPYIIEVINFNTISEKFKKLALKKIILLN